MSLFLYMYFLKLVTNNRICLFAIWPILYLAGDKSAKKVFCCMTLTTKIGIQSLTTVVFLFVLVLQFH